MTTEIKSTQNKREQALPTLNFEQTGGFCDESVANNRGDYVIIPGRYPYYLDIIVFFLKKNKNTISRKIRFCKKFISILLTEFSYLFYF